MDVQGSVEFAERLLTCGSDAEILSVKGVTLRRLTSLAESSHDAPPAAVAPDDGSSISFMPREPAGQVEGYPVVGVINSKTVDLSMCTIEGEGKCLLRPTYSVWLSPFLCLYSIHICNGCVVYSVMFMFGGSSYRQAGGGWSQCTISSLGGVKDCHYLPGCFGSKAEIPLRLKECLSLVAEYEKGCLHTHTHKF